MAKRIGRSVIETENGVYIASSSAFVGKTEGEGPLAAEFDHCFPDDGIGQSSWENAEAELLYRSVKRTMDKAQKTEDDIDLILAGDLLNQCTASTYAVRGLSIPFAGLFGACSTMAYALALAAVLADGGGFRHIIAGASSHFCSAEKQFRYPLEYGGQRSTTAQRTVTGGASCLVTTEKQTVRISRAAFGQIADLGIRDTSNMGAAMAPAAAGTISGFLRDTDTSPTDYDMILTGDLGSVGSRLLTELLLEKEETDIRGIHADCGNMIFDAKRQDVHAGGSGCACSGTVVCSKILRQMNAGELKHVLFVGTGALMSPLISLQGESIPGIAHAVELIAEEGEKI